jgi:hypothetical protein
MAKFHSSLWLSKIPLCIKNHIFLIHLLVVGHLGCFHNLAIVNSVAVNMGMQVPLEYPQLHSFGYIPRSGIVAGISS